MHRYYFVIVLLGRSFAVRIWPLLFRVTKCFASPFLRSANRRVLVLWCPLSLVPRHDNKRTRVWKFCNRQVLRSISSINARVVHFGPSRHNRRRPPCTRTHYSSTISSISTMVQVLRSSLHRRLVHLPHHHRVINTNQPVSGRTHVIALSFVYYFILIYSSFVRRTSYCIIIFLSTSPTCYCYSYLIVSPSTDLWSRTDLLLTLVRKIFSLQNTLNKLFYSLLYIYKSCHWSPNTHQTKIKLISQILT